MHENRRPKSERNSYMHTYIHAYTHTHIYIHTGQAHARKPKTEVGAKFIYRFWMPFCVFDHGTAVEFAEIHRGLGMYI